MRQNYYKLKLLLEYNLIQVASWTKDFVEYFNYYYIDQVFVKKFYGINDSKISTFFTNRQQR